MTENSPHQDLPLLDDEPIKIKTAKKGHGFILFLWFILILVIAAACAFGWWQLQIMQQQLEKNQALFKQIPTLQNNVTQQLKTYSQSLNQQQQQLSLVQNNVTRLDAILSSNENNWLIVESFHLIQLADSSLSFEKNIPTTLALLQLADQRLFQVANPALNNIRKLIANDIAALRAIQPVDVTGIYLQLQALRDQTMSASLIDKQFENNPNKNILATPNTQSTSIWMKSLNMFSHALSRVLVIRHHTAPIEPLLAPNQEQVLKQNLYWLYEQAQWATLHQKSAVYQASLKQISALITQYYQMNNQSQAILQNIAQLQKINIEPALPNISDLATAMQKYMKDKEQAKLLQTETVTAKPTTTPVAPKQNVKAGSV